MTPLLAGLYRDISHVDYHADPCQAPSLSASIATVICSRSCWHGHHEHPRLGGARRPSKRGLDFGSAVAAVVLGGGAELVVIDADDYRTKKAQQARDAAYEDGHTPLLAKDMEKVERVAGALVQHARIPSQWREATAIWEFPYQHIQRASPVLYQARCRIDALEISEGSAEIVDIKTTQDASPEFQQRNSIEHGFDIQAAANVEAIETLYPELAGRVTFTDLFIEIDSLLIVPNLVDGPMLELGRSRWRRAKRLWGRCMSTNTWPGYVQKGECVRLEPPKWALDQEGERAERTGCCALLQGA